MSLFWISSRLQRPEGMEFFLPKEAGKFSDLEGSNSPPFSGQSNNPTVELPKLVSFSVRNTTFSYLYQFPMTKTTGNSLFVTP
jgi:hypothetical protein